MKLGICEGNIRPTSGFAPVVDVGRLEGHAGDGSPPGRAVTAPPARYARDRPDGCDPPRAASSMQRNGDLLPADGLVQAIGWQWGGLLSSLHQQGPVGPASASFKSRYSGLGWQPGSRGDPPRGRGSPHDGLHFREQLANEWGHGPQRGIQWVRHDHHFFFGLEQDVQFVRSLS